MSRTRGSGKKDAFGALVEARRARAEAQQRKTQVLRQQAAQDLGLALLEADAGEADPAALQEIVAAVVELGSGAALARLKEPRAG